MTERFKFFYHTQSIYSQWNPTAPFTKFGIRFKTAENFMMWRKGILFGAAQSLLDDILAADPRNAKALGRQIPNFQPAIWDVVAKPLVKEGNLEKFSQNPHALGQMLSTEGATLVEASPHDTIWGIGLKETDPRALKRETWLGTNWLGEVLTDIRDIFLKVKQNGLPILNDKP